MAGKKHPVKWDEQNLTENAEEAERNPRQKILEPKTPFHTMEEDGETPAAFPPKAAPARAARPDELNQQLRPEMDLAALAGMAEMRRTEEPEDDEVERQQKFEANRKNHYKTEGLAALRTKAAAMDEEEDDED